MNKPMTSPARRNSNASGGGRRLLSIPAALLLTGFLAVSGMFSSPKQEIFLVGTSVAVTALLFILLRDYMVCAVAQALGVALSLSLYLYRLIVEQRTIGQFMSFEDAFRIGLVWLSGFVVIMLIRLFSPARRVSKKNLSDWNHAFHLTSIVFLLAYAALLVWLFYALRTTDLTGERSLNLIPLKGAFSVYWPHIRAGQFKYGIFIQFFGNLLIFSPLGFYLRVYAKKMPMQLLALVPVLLSGTIEATQYIWNMGKSDIDDFWMNVLGLWIGVFTYYLIGWIRRLVSHGSEKNIC
jgi:glycopeptide antibiotics resistance protein